MTQKMGRLQTPLNTLKLCCAKRFIIFFLLKYVKYVIYIISFFLTKNSGSCQKRLFCTARHLNMCVTRKKVFLDENQITRLSDMKKLQKKYEMSSKKILTDLV